MNLPTENWVTHQVDGHPCNVFLPERRSAHGYTILYLHGIRMESLQGKAAFVELFQQQGFTVVSPQCGPCWWTDRITPAFEPQVSAQRFILDSILPFIVDVLGAQPPRIALLGINMGGQGVLRMSYLFPDTFPVVAAMSPAIDYQQRVRDGDPVLMEMYGDPESARQDTVILHIHPLNWPRNQFFCCDPADRAWFDSSDRLRMKLGSLGVPFECDLETSVGGHGFEYYDHMAPRAIGFLAAALERERRRSFDILDASDNDRG